MACLFAPSRWKDVGRVCVYPEVIAFRVAVKVEAEPVTADLGHRENAEEGRVLGVDALKLHTHFEEVLARWERLWRVESGKH